MQWSRRSCLLQPVDARGASKNGGEAQERCSGKVATGCRLPWSPRSVHALGISPLKLGARAPESERSRDSSTEDCLSAPPGRATPRIVRKKKARAGAGFHSFSLQSFVMPRRCPRGPEGHPSGRVLSLLSLAYTRQHLCPVRCSRVGVRLPQHREERSATTTASDRKAL